MTDNRSVLSHQQSVRGQDAGSGGASLSLLVLANILLRNHRLIGGTLGMTFIAFVAVALLQQPRYVAQSVFMPEVVDNGGQLAGIAAQFGIDVDPRSSGETLDFYVELLTSSELLHELAESKLQVVSPDSVYIVSVAEFLGEPVGGDPARALKAIDGLRDRISVTGDGASKLVTVRTVARQPGLAVAMNERLLALVNSFNLDRRQSRALAESRFLRDRVAEAERELRQAESDFERFLAQNRRYGESPQLTFEATRHQRRIEVRQQVYLSLAQAYEQARVNEVRNTPVVTIVDRPGVAVRRHGLGVIKFGVLGLVFGLGLALSLVLLRENVSRQRKMNPAEYEEFVRRRRLLLRSRSDIIPDGPH